MDAFVESALSPEALYESAAMGTEAANLAQGLSFAAKRSFDKLMRWLSDHKDTVKSSDSCCSSSV